MGEQMTKPKVAFYWCASCGGCEEAVVDLAEDILKVVEAVDIVLWPVAMDFKKSDVEPLLQDGSDHGFVYLMGHGSGDAFYFDDFSFISSSDLLSYSSASDYHIPIVLSVACINGTFDEEIWWHGFNTSFGEACLLSPAGGIAYLGASRSALSSLFYSVSSTNPGVISHYQALISEMNLLVFRRYHRGGNLLNTIFSKTLYLQAF